jgi:hypothetical protein
MTRQQAKRLARYLTKAGWRKDGTGCRAEVVGDRIVFSGPSGQHDVAYAEALGGIDRVLAHWRGFRENNGQAPKAQYGRYVAWLTSKGLVVGQLRQPYKSTHAYAMEPGVYWHVSRVRADGSVCKSNTHRLPNAGITEYLL